MTVKKQVVLHNFENIRPKNVSSQSRGLDWIAAAHTAAEKLKLRDLDEAQYFRTLRKLVERVGCSPEKIEFRAHELDDFLNDHWNEHEIFKLYQVGSGLGIEARSQFFARTVEDVFLKFYENKSAPHSLIHVTCTGYISPSGAQRLVERKGWNRTTSVLHAYHMGCYAALPAIKMARGVLASDAFLDNVTSQVDIVHTELCTLHFNPELHTAEQLVVQSLFADGHIKYSAGFSESGFKVVALHEEIVPESTSAMTWQCSEFGMKMSLSKDVPQLIAARLKPFVVTLFEKAKVDCAKIWKDTHFAIHPGGPKIIERACEILEVDAKHSQTSRDILREFGNMSSATLPHVWQRMFEDPSIGHGCYVVSLAFGPGLTMSGAVFQKV